MWQIEFYEKENGEIPVQDFLLSVDKKMRAKAFKEIDLLEEYGTSLR